jgi:hypothetical protein
MQTGSTVPPAPSPSSPATNATDASTPRPSSAYTYTSPPTAGDYSYSTSPSHTTSGTLTTATAPAYANATTTASPGATTITTAQPATPTSSAGGVRFNAAPRSNQSPDQQARDQYDCYRFGVTQTGFDPMSGTIPAAGKPGQAEFDRARAACFEARGYNTR